MRYEVDDKMMDWIRGDGSLWLVFRCCSYVKVEMWLCNNASVDSKSLKTIRTIKSRSEVQVKNHLQIALVKTPEAIHTEDGMYNVWLKKHKWNYGMGTTTK